MNKLYNLARMTTATQGTGTITLGSAVSGYLTFDLAGVQNSDVVSYGIKDGANSEVGTGTYTSSGTTLTRTVIKSTNSNNAISLSGTAEVYITALAEDLSPLISGPASAVDNRIVSFDNTTGKLVKDSGVLSTSVVVGPSSVSDGFSPVFDGTTGKLLKQGVSFWGLRKMTPPVDTGWSWDNQSSSTIDSTYGYEYLHAPRQSAIKLSGRYRTPTNAHYRIEACFMHNITLYGGTGGDSGYAFGFRDGGGKLVNFFLQVETVTPKYSFNKWSSSVGYVGDYIAYGPAISIGEVVYRNPTWLRLDYDGTNIIAYDSFDGNHWCLFSSQLENNYLASGKPDVFWGAYVNGNAVDLALLSWTEVALA